MPRPGDLVLLYHNDKAKYLVRLPAKGAFSTHRGNIPYEQILSADYGATVKTHLGTTYHVLRPTLADLQTHVRRCTTIVYPKEAGAMLLQTLIAPGARVIEVGSGSGALTLVLANYVRPSGRGFSYEARADFSKNAAENIRTHGLSDYVTFRVRDVARQG
ncbi:MAG: hypothetical protein ABIK62_07815, partial [candidate division WOR-3 bacterium]